MDDIAYIVAIVSNMFQLDPSYSQMSSAADSSASTGEELPDTDDDKSESESESDLVAKSKWYKGKRLPAKSRAPSIGTWQDSPNFEEDNQLAQTLLEDLLRSMGDSNDTKRELIDALEKVFSEFEKWRIAVRNAVPYNTRHRIMTSSDTVRKRLIAIISGSGSHDPTRKRKRVDSGVTNIKKRSAVTVKRR